MSEPTGCAVRCHFHDSYCLNCDLLVGLDGAARGRGGTRRRWRADGDGGVGPAGDGCPTCGGRLESWPAVVRLVDSPASAAGPAAMAEATWECVEPACPTGVFTEQDEAIETSGDVDGQGVPVGGASDPARARLGVRGGPSARYRVKTVWGSIRRSWPQRPPMSPGSPA